MYRSYYGDVTKVEIEGERGVRFSFQIADNRELPTILGEMPVLSKAYWATRDFEKTTLDPPLGSGAYKIESVDPGRSITYRRVADYWGADLPVNKGRNNVDVIRYDYYRDATIALEAFKAGQYDVRRENSSKAWATAYDSPALRGGLIKKEEIPNELPSGMQGFGYNLRRPMFQDPKVRQALAYAFDFEWSNKNLFYGAYTRTRSYFDNSELAATGVPQGEELKILEAYRGQIPDAVFTTDYDPPKYDGSGNIRDGLRQALALLKDAGWSFKGEKLVNDKTGAAVRVRDPARRSVDGADRRCPLCRTSSGWGSPPRCARSMSRNTKSGWRRSISTWRSSAFRNRCRPATSSASSSARQAADQAGQPQPARDQEQGDR